MDHQRRAKELADHLTDLVADEDPKRLADRTLNVIVHSNRARIAALFSAECNGQAAPVLTSSIGMDEAGIEHARQGWARHRTGLMAGLSVKIGEAPRSRHLVAADPGEDGMVALLYLDKVAAFDEATTRSLLRLIAGTLRPRAKPSKALTATVSEVEAYVERTTAKEFQRHRLVLLLDRHEWNVARVARLEGVTRNTVYGWLERFGIERKHISKST